MCSGYGYHIVRLIALGVLRLGTGAGVLYAEQGGKAFGGKGCRRQQWLQHVGVMIAEIENRYLVGRCGGWLAPWGPSL